MNIDEVQRDIAIPTAADIQIAVPIEAGKYIAGIRSRVKVAVGDQKLDGDIRLELREHALGNNMQTGEHSSVTQLLRAVLYQYCEHRLPIPREYRVLF